MKDTAIDSTLSETFGLSKINLKTVKTDLFFTVTLTILAFLVIGMYGYIDLAFTMITASFSIATFTGLQFYNSQSKNSLKRINQFISVCSILTIVALHLFVPFLILETFLVFPMAITFLIYYDDSVNKNKFVYILIGLSLLMFLRELSILDFNQFSHLDFKINFIVLGFILVLSCFKVYLLFNWGDNFKIELSKRDTKYKVLESDFDNFMNDIPSGYCIYGEDGNKIFCSQRSAEIFGYKSRNEFKILPLDKFCHSDSIEEIQSHFEQLSNNQFSTQPFNAKGLTVDGKVRVLKGSVLINEYQGEKRICYVYDDVTEAIEQQESEKQREALYSYVVNSSKDGILAVDTDLNILAINSFFKLGFKKTISADLQVGSKLTEVLPREFIEKYEQKIGEVFNNGVVHFQDEIEIPEGGTLSLDTKVVPMKDDKDQMIGSIIICRDITALKNTERELKEKEKQARTIIDAIPGGIAIIGLDSMLEYVSPNTAEIFGYSENELEGQNMLSVFEPESQEKILSYVSDLLNGLTPSVVILKGIKKDKSTFSLEGKGRIIIDDITGYKKIIGVFIDVTDKLKSEKNLEESEATLQAIFNGTTDSILAYDTDYNIIAYNKRWRDDISKFTNTVPSHGLNLNDILPTEAFEFLETNTKITLENQHLSIQKQHSLISRMYMDIKSSKLLDQNGQTLGILEVIRDVSELKKKETELLESKKVYQTIFEKSPMSILKTDGPNIGSVNPYFCMKYGYPEEEVIGKPLLSFVVAEEIESAIETANHIAQDKVAVVETIHRVIPKDGEARYCLIRVITEFDEETNKPISSLISMSDIHELKLSEKRLKQSELKYKSLFDKTLTGIYISQNGIIQDANPIFSQLLGYNPVEVIGLKVTHLLAETERVRIENSIKSDIVNKKANTDLVTIAKHKQGGSIEIILRVVYQYDEKGNYVGDFGSISDLSDLKFAEQALYESETRNRNLIETLPGGILECDLDGTITFASTNAGEILGVDKNKLIGQSAFDFIHPDYVSPMISSFTPMIRENLVATNSLKLIPQQEGAPPVYIDSKSRLMNSSSESNSKILTVFLDVSDEIQMRQDLNEKKAIMTATIENSPDMIVAIDTKNRVIGYNNKSAHNLENFANIKIAQGANFNELLSQSAFSEDIKTQWEKRTSKVWKGQSVDSLDTFPLRNGKKLYHQHHMSPILDEENNVLGSIIYSRNVTETKEYQHTIENQLGELEKYIESNMQLENFAYIASHDLKAPLRTVNSFAYLLKKSAYNSLDDKEKEFLDIIDESSRKMQVLIDDLLTFSRTNTQKIDIQNVSFNSILTDVIHQLSADIKQSRVQIGIDKAMADLISADAVKLSQLLSNLISNAIKFSSKTDTPKIHISGRENDNYWYYSIEDNGIGIKKENQKEIFSLFKKLHSNDVFEGTGLGLSICSKIVEQHKGEIWVDSELKKYSKFTFSISKKLQKSKLIE